MQQHSVSHLEKQVAKSKEMNRTGETGSQSGLKHKCRVTWNFSRKTCPGTRRSSTQSRWWWCHLQGPSACHPSPKRNRQLPCPGTSLHLRNARVLRPVVLEAPWRWLKSVSWTCLPMTTAPPWLWECWPCIPALFVTRASGAQSCLWWSPLDLSVHLGLEILKPYGLFPPILSSLWCWLHVEELLMLAVISHPANLFAEQGTENMSEIHRFMLHCSNHWLFFGFLPSRRAEANASAFTTFWFDSCHGRPRCWLHQWGRFGKTWKHAQEVLRLNMCDND